ncbi:unnamed protein product [Prunus brigantina]
MMCSTERKLVGLLRVILFEGLQIRGLMKAAELGLSSFLVASDLQEVVALPKGDGELGLWSNLENIVDDTRRLMVQLRIVGVCFQPQLGN